MDMAGTRYWNWNLLLAVVADHDDDDEPTQSRICVQKFPFQWRNFTSLKLQLHRQRTLLYVCRYLVKRDVVDDYMVGSVVNECKKYRVAGVKSFPWRTYISWTIQGSLTGELVLSSWSTSTHVLVGYVLLMSLKRKTDPLHIRYQNCPFFPFVPLSGTLLEMCVLYLGLYLLNHHHPCLYIVPHS